MTPHDLIAQARTVKADVVLGGRPMRDQLAAWNALRGLARDLADELESAAAQESIHPDDFRALAVERDLLAEYRATHRSHAPAECWLCRRTDAALATPARPVGVRAALKKYGRHLDDCVHVLGEWTDQKGQAVYSWRRCTCGLSAALAAPASEEALETARTLVRQWRERNHHSELGWIDLDAEAERVLRENLWTLYGGTPIPAPEAGGLAEAGVALRVRDEIIADYRRLTGRAGPWSWDEAHLAAAIDNALARATPPGGGGREEG